jgi:hypothetical protein
MDFSPKYKPEERFWPYVDVPEQPTDEELAALDPDIQEILFRVPPRPFSITLAFPPFDGPEYESAVEMARNSAEYRESRTLGKLMHRARFYPDDALRLRDLFNVVGRYEGTEVLIDDRPVPYARELWLPLVWFLITR